MIGMVDNINRYLSGNIKVINSISKKKFREYCRKNINDYFENNDDGKTFIKGSNILPKIIFNHFKLLKKDNKSTLQMLKEIKEKYPCLDESQICFSIIYCFSYIK